MDDKQLDKILSDIDVPEANENARKRAVNLAVAEFEQYQQKKSKNFQGFPILARLMDRTNQNDRRDPMEKASRKKLVYGGMATAFAVVLVATTSLYQLSNNTVGTGSTVTSAELSKVQFALNEEKSGKNFSSIAENITTAIPSPWRGPSDKKAQKAETEADFLAGQSLEMADAEVASPVPAAPPMMAQKMKRERLEEGRAQVGSVIQPAPADMDSVSPRYQDEGRDKFEKAEINPFKQVSEAPVSTFSVDVDTASYSFVRRQLNSGVMPNPDAVRIEEMINYFDYNYPLPESREQPFKPTVTMMDSPWAKGKKLMHIGIKGFDLQGERPKSNLVFLLDVSGSMNAPDKLPLLVNSLKMLVDNLNEDDKVSIVVYAGAAGAVLEPTAASDKTKIYNALNSLQAGGSTAGAAGINLAYQLAEENFDEEAVNRVILATDGDFNVGITDREKLQDFVEEKRKTGIFLSVFGFGQGNYNDHLMQTLAQNGNGIAAYIDTLSEARKILVEEATSSLFPIAKDVKIQIEFNPDAVAEYRLVGYETRALKREDFNNDKVDAGDIGAGHTVTAIYEIVPVGSEATSVDPLRYGDKEETPAKTEEASDFDGEYAFLKVRYKLPKEDTSKLLTTPVTTANDAGSIKDMIENADNNSLMNDIAFSTSVAGFAQMLKDDKHLQDLSYDDIIETANKTKGEDPFGYRTEFIQLVRLAKSIDN